MKSSAFIVIVVLCAIADASPQGSASHYDNGRRAYAAAKFADAIVEFQLAYDEFPAPELLHDIAVAYRRLGQPCDSLVHFERYLDAKPDAPNKREVVASIAELRSKCPRPAPPTPAAPVAPAREPASRPDAVAIPTAVVAVAPTIASASPYRVEAAAGVVLLHAGPVVLPPVGQLDVGIIRSLDDIAGNKLGHVHAGARLAFARLPYDDLSSGTAWIVAPELIAGASRDLTPNIELVGRASLGATILMGLGTGNPFTQDGMDTAAIVTLRVRGELGVAWRVNKRMTVQLFPLGYQWSPRRGSLAADIGAVHGFGMSTGVTVGW